MRKNLVLFLTLASVVGLSACSPKASNSTVQLRLPATLSSKETAQSITVNHVVINVSGSDFETIFKQFSFNQGASSDQVVSIQVPRGSGRLIQVIEAGDDQTTGSTNIYYGDSKFDVDSENVSAAVTLSLLTTSVGDARVAGRFLKPDGSGPTGTLNVLYHPAGKPTMLVGQRPIFAGWFDAFSFWNGSFDYQVAETGDVLFSGTNATTSSYAQSFAFGSAPQKNALIEVPSAYRTNFQNPSDPSQRELNPVRRFIYGYFGDSTATNGKNLCYSGTAAAITNLYAGNLAASVNVNWNPTSALASDARVLSGGLLDTDTNCSGSKDFSDALHFLSSNIANRDRLLGFQGPFRFKNYSSGVFSNPIYDSATQRLTVDWTFLPGVAESKAIDGATVFYRRGHSWSDRSGIDVDDGISCNNLPADFASAGDFATSVTSAVVPVAPTDWSSNNIQVLVCPYRQSLLASRRYFDAGLLVDLSAGSTSPQVTIAGADNLTAGGTCQSYTLGLQQAGNSLSANSPVVLNISSSPLMGQGSATIYSSGSGCSSAGITSATIAAGSSSVTVMVAGASAGLVKLNVTSASTLSGAAIQPAQKVVAVGGVSAAVSGNFEIESTHLAVGRCYPVRLSLFDSTGKLGNYTTQSVTITNNPTNVGLFSDASCLTSYSSGSIPFATSEYSRVIFMKPLVATTGSLAFTMLGTQRTLNYDAAPNSFDHWGVVRLNAENRPTSWYTPTECYPAQIRAQASNGATVAAPSSGVHTVSASTSHQTFSNVAGSCASPSSSLNLNVAAGSIDSSPIFYVKDDGAVGENALRIDNASVPSLYATPTVSMLNPAGFAYSLAGVCTPFTLKTPAAVPADLKIDTIFSGSQFFSDSACTAAAPSGYVVIPSGSSYLTYYARIPAGASATPLARLPLANALSSITLSSFKVAMSVNGGSAANAGACVPLNLTSPQSLPLASTFAINVATGSTNLDPTASGPFFTDSNCGTPTNSPQISFAGGATAASAPVYVRMKSSALSGALQFSITGVAPNTTNYSDSSSTLTCSSVSCN